MILVHYSRSEPYRSLYPGEPGRPLIAVRLQHRELHFDTLGLIDSGADGTVFHVSWAQVLGFSLDLSAAGRTRGVGGTASIWHFDMHLVVGGERIAAPVGFTAGVPTSFGLLGRRDFFMAFNVGLDQRGGQILLHPNSR